MRLTLKTSSPNGLVPYMGTIQKVVGCFHKWLDKDELHSKTSLYSISHLNGGIARKAGLDFRNGSFLNINSVSFDIIDRIVKGVKKDPVMFYGMEVKEIVITETPNFSEKERFHLLTGFLAKRNIGTYKKFYTYNDAEINEVITKTMKTKLSIAGLGDEEIQLTVDKDFYAKRIKNFYYRDRFNLINHCPVIVEGTKKAVKFAWNVGIGQSTGIGLGAIK